MEQIKIGIYHLNNDLLLSGVPVFKNKKLEYETIDITNPNNRLPYYGIQPLMYQHLPDGYRKFLDEFGPEENDGNWNDITLMSTKYYAFWYNKNSDNMEDITTIIFENRKEAEKMWHVYNTYIENTIDNMINIAKTEFKSLQK